MNLEVHRRGLMAFCVRSCVWPLNTYECRMNPQGELDVALEVSASNRHTAFARANLDSYERRTAINVLRAPPFRTFFGTGSC